MGKKAGGAGASSPRKGTGGRTRATGNEGTPPPVARPKRGREGKAAKRQRAAEITRRLRAEYPDAETALDHESPYQLLVATILSAQCTDERVNMVTPALFARFPDAESLSGGRPEEVEELIRSTGFFRSKTKSLLGMSAALVERHGGEVPRTMDELTELPGVGRKTANVVLGNAFDIAAGVVVDTHVSRLSQRLAFTAETTPEAIERDLAELFPKEEWVELPHLLILHGRAVCKARKPLCERCVVNDLCPSSRV
ncbi:MAG TPA: endonuclease III [Longimicrobiales bacterium]|nr:endonuclease III [Longimicrobiales bacterium]